MSWNKYFIIVLDVESKDLNELVDLTGYGKILSPFKKVNFRIASNKNYEGIGFGLFQNNFWIISGDQTEKFFNEEPSVLEKNLCKRFSSKTILALAENGTVGAFGLNLIVNGNRLRVISGCDGEYDYEFGEPLEIENTNLKKVTTEMDNSEKEEIIANEGEQGFSDYVKFESLWRAPFDLFTEKIGKTIDEIYDDNPEFEIYKQK
jgi:hypothetical protein